MALSDASPASGNLARSIRPLGFFTFGVNLRSNHLRAKAAETNNGESNLGTSIRWSGNNRSPSTVIGERQPCPVSPYIAWYIRSLGERGMVELAITDGAGDQVRLSIACCPKPPKVPAVFLGSPGTRAIFWSVIITKHLSGSLEITVVRPRWETPPLRHRWSVLLSMLSSYRISEHGMTRDP